MTITRSGWEKARDAWIRYLARRYGEKRVLDELKYLTKTSLREAIARSEQDEKET